MLNCSTFSYECRERGARALEERLGSTAKTVADGVPVKGSSKGNLETIGSDDLV